MIWPLKSLLSYRELIFEMILRDLKAQYYGSILGLFWAVVNPLVHVAFYVFLFGFVFRVRFGTGKGLFDYTVFVLAGMMPWLFLTQTAMRSSQLLRSNVGLIKQVIYPLETLALIDVGVVFPGTAIGILMIVVILPFTSFELGWSLMLLPLAILLTVLFAIGVSWLLCLVGIVLKDISYMLSILFMMGIYLTPIFYTPAFSPQAVACLLPLNPFSHFVYLFQDAITQLEFHPLSWGIATILSVACFYSGHTAIQKFRKMVGDFI